MTTETMQALLDPIPSKTTRCIDCGMKVVVCHVPGVKVKKRLCKKCKAKRNGDPSC